MALRWGILSAGKISHDFCVSVSTLNPAEHKLQAVGARSLDSATDFAKVHSMPTAYGSYEEVVKDANVDVVYIGAINTQHLPLAKLCFDHGKHVLCEKPLGVNVKETKEIYAYAKQKKCFVMEALWSRFFPVYKKLKEEIDKGTIGEVLQVNVNFGLRIADVDRVKLKELGGGTILDIGIYCVQFASLVFGGEAPEKVVAAGTVNEHGVDESVSATLMYSKGRKATLTTHSRVEFVNEGYVYGTKGFLKIPVPFWCPTEIITPNGSFTFPLPETAKKYNFSNSTGLAYQCNEVRHCIQKGLLESSVYSPRESLVIAEIMESVRKQLGVVYLQD